MRLHGRDRGILGPTRAGHLPSLFVILALTALLVVPMATQRDVQVLREEIEQAAEPGRTVVTRIQYLLARQTSALRGYFITADSVFLQQYLSMRLEETEAYGALAPLIDRLGAGPLARFVHLRALSSEWHARVEEDELSIARAPGLVRELPFEQDLYQEALAAASELDQSIAAAAADRRVEIRRAERRAGVVNAALVLLALAATTSVGLLSRRMQRLAHEAEARRLEAVRALEESARAVKTREQLIRGVTHDVKNPLGAADGYAELLEMGLRGELTGDQQRMVEGIRRLIGGALQIINDLLELSRAEAGGLPISRRVVGLANLAQEAVEDHRSAAIAAGHALQTTASAPGAWVDVDPVRVQQIIGNLLSNAIKYTPSPGRIDVSVMLAEGPHAPGPGAWAAVSVTDSGPGIPEGERERIFEEFHRVGSSSLPGHGLGLPISRRLALLLDGELILANASGPGSTFVLWLPAVAPPRPAPH